MRRTTLAAAFLLVGITAVVSNTGPQTDRTVKSVRTPKLLVLIVVDQMRGDYVDKFRHQWSRGLHRLVTDGAWFRRADYPYYNTVTCPGHTSVSTGTVPSVHGIVLNSWWDRDAKKMVACTDDEHVAAISYGKPVSARGESLARLRSTTLADELRAQLPSPPRIAAFSLKARAALPLGGRRPDAVAWFDDEGAWVTSTAVATAPVAAVRQFVAANPVENDARVVWDRALPKDMYLYEDPAVALHARKGEMTPAFPHPLLDVEPALDKSFYDRWQSSPLADEYLARMSTSVLETLHVADAAGPNLLGIGFSTLDKVGHDYGPHSHEVQDVLIRLDRTLGDLWARLDRLVGSGNYTVALTADHGVAPVPERMNAMGLDAGRVSADAIVSSVEASIAATLGPGTYVARFVHDYVYLQPGVYENLRARAGAVKKLTEDLRRVPGVLNAYSRDDLEANRFEDPMLRLAAASHDASRSGDVMVVFRPYWIESDSTAAHGTGYAYDTHVPVILMGKGITPGEYLQPASPTDIAPTLAFLAGITMPQAAGRVLAEALSPVTPAHPIQSQTTAAR